MIEIQHDFNPRDDVTEELQRKFINRILDILRTSNSYAECIDSLANFLKPYFDKIQAKHPELSGQIREAFRNLHKCVNLKERDEFTNCILTASKPLQDIALEHLKTIEEVDAERFNTNNGFTPLSRLLSYKIIENGTVVEIHMPPGTQLSIGEKIRGYKEGFKNLANLLQHNLQIKRIVGTSRLVCKSPQFFKHWGFSITKVDESLCRAEASRDKFLRYIEEFKKRRRENTLKL